MSLLWRAITILLFTITLTSAYSCKLTRNLVPEVNCICDDRDTYFNLTCPLNGEESFDVLADMYQDFYEIDCKNQKINNVSFVPELRRDRSDQVGYFGLIDCSMKELDNLAYRITNTRQAKRLALKKMKHIIPSAFKKFKIDLLYILESELTTLPEDTIYDLPDLEQIFINENKITSLPDNFFQKAEKIRGINLGQNNISHISPKLFAGLHNLKSLHLFGNRLMNIDSVIFKSLNNLQELELMTNKLTELPENAFEHLPKLSDLSLRGNSFVTFPENLFKFNKKLSTLKFTNNIHLTHLPSKLLANLTELSILHLNYCNLTTLPKNFLQDTTNLRELVLEHNSIEILEDGFFRNVTNLAILNLSFNKLVIMDDTFTGLRNLENLNLQYNSLSNLTKNSFKHFKNLIFLDMSNNKLTMEPEHFKGEKFSVLPLLDKLIELNLQDNEIPCIFSDWVTSFLSLKTLNLAYNNITTLDYSQLQFTQDHTIDVDLTYNEIHTIDLSTAEILLNANKNNTPQATRNINLDGNPINCDCRVYDLVRYIDGTMSEEIRKTLKLQLDNVICQTAKKYLGTPLTELKSESLICVLDDGPKLPSTCNKSLSHYQFRQYDKRLIMDCSYTGLTELPQINFDSSFRLRTFGIEVFLHGNNIKKLSKPSEGYDNVVMLDLSYNNISEITWIPPRIEVLKLDNNNLTFLTSEELSLINKTSIRNLTFHNNPWKCDCKLINFTKYLQENFKKISNLHDITCDEESPRRELTLLSSEDLCTNNFGLIAIICALLAFCFLLTTILVALYFRYKLHIKVWLYAHNWCLYLITEDEIDQDKTFDAFISFSHEDEDFVVGELLPGLEQGPHNYKLCVHFRDWQPGEFITTNIARSIDESRRTVVVLSPGFLRSEWGRMEFRTAHTEALKEGRVRVIVVMYGDIEPIDDLDPELKAYLTTNTYIKWGTPWFWDNLRYALPHSSKFLKSSKNIPSLIYNQPEKTQIIGDKMDLIHEPSTPPAATTPPADSVRHLNDPLLPSALNVTLIDGTLINNAPDKLKTIV